VALFENARTAEEIRADMLAVSSNAQNLLYAQKLPIGNTQTDTVNGISGQTFNSLNKDPIDLNGSPRTIEAVLQLSKNSSLRGGVILGNYDGKKSDEFNLEIYTGGQPRLYYKVGGVSYSHLFQSDIRSDLPRHVALTVDGTQTALYVDGVLTETAVLQAELAACTDLCIGGDNRNMAPIHPRHCTDEY
jgi:hypothetical protein